MIQYRHLLPVLVLAATSCLIPASSQTAPTWAGRLCWRGNTKRRRILRDDFDWASGCRPRRGGALPADARAARAQHRVEWTQLRWVGVAERHSTAQHSTAQHSTAQHSAARKGHCTAELRGGALPLAALSLFAARPLFPEIERSTLNALPTPYIHLTPRAHCIEGRLPHERLSLASAFARCRRLPLQSSPLTRSAPSLLPQPADARVVVLLLTSRSHAAPVCGHPRHPSLSSIR